MSWWSTVQKDEQWVVAEIANGWKALERDAEKAVIDIKGIFDYVASHQNQIDSTAKAILGDVSVIAALAGHPEVGAAAAAIGVSAEAVVGLAANINKGSVPLSTAVDALHKVKDAQTAVNALVKRATAKPGS